MDIKLKFITMKTKTILKDIASDVMRMAYDEANETEKQFFTFSYKDFGNVNVNVFVYERGDWKADPTENDYEITKKIIATLDVDSWVTSRNRPMFNVANYINQLINN